VSIIEDLSPHLWAGSDASDNWVKAYTAWEQAEVVTDGVYKMAQPTSAVATGERKTGG
jgi:hypothetical protein